MTSAHGLYGPGLDGEPAMPIIASAEESICWSLDYLDEEAVRWAREADIAALCALVAAVPNDRQRAKRIEALARQAWAEGAWKMFSRNVDSGREDPGREPYSADHERRPGERFIRAEPVPAPCLPVEFVPDPYQGVRRFVRRVSQSLSALVRPHRRMRRKVGRSGG